MVSLYHVIEYVQVYFCESFKCEYHCENLAIQFSRFQFIGKSMSEPHIGRKACAVMVYKLCTYIHSAYVRSNLRLTQDAQYLPRGHKYMYKSYV